MCSSDPERVSSVCEVSAEGVLLGLLRSAVGSGAGATRVLDYLSETTTIGHEA